MELNKQRIILTGAGGGIGSQLAQELAQRGARLLLADRNRAALERTAEAAMAHGTPVSVAEIDLLDGSSHAELVRRANAELGGIDVLVNNAGLMSFRPIHEEDPLILARILQLNTVAPMLLTRAVLPQLLHQGSGKIVNVGSTFGSIGFGYFAAYSASKFGLRGFSEALRRELGGSGVSVTYVAPRAVRTALNTSSIYRMAEAVKMNMDPPDRVARDIVSAIDADARDCYFGFPESLFVRINALLPRLVDMALRKQTRVMAHFARDVQSQ